MKQSKVLKIISYIVLPIVIGMLIISMIYISIKNSPYYNEETYFSSEEFTSEYMSTLGSLTNKLIHKINLNDYKRDGEMQIYITDYMNYSRVNKMNFLIIYKNQAITNVNLDTIEEIKQNISSHENVKKVNIENGEISADSENMSKYGLKYLKQYETRYYTTDTETPNDMLSNGVYVEWIEPKINDFTIYSSYEEVFYPSQGREIANKFLNMISPNEEYINVILPLSSVLTILIVVYLIISIGHKKEEGIILNDLDKIPLEIIIFVATIIGCIPFIPLTFAYEDINAIISLISTIYLVIYILMAVTLHTIIKRIKAKTFWKSTIIGKIFIFILKCFKKINIKMKNGWTTITYSKNATTKVLIYFVTIVGISLLILGVFGFSALSFLLLIGLLVFILYKIIVTLNQFSQIENKTKEMYEGDNKNELEPSDFINDFQDIVKYLNDISNGFENAVQDRMKSERMKAELITNVSHDIKTPLTSIINYVDLLKQEKIDNEKAREYIEILDNKSQRLKKLTEDLIEASKVSTGNISLNLEKINVVELINQATGEFEDKFKKRGLQAIIDCKNNEINIMADSRYMYRIVENLFSNISKYALDNSRVYIDIKLKQKEPSLLLQEPSPFVQIEFKNISKERLNISAEELMQRFVRGDKSRTTDGSGLGLSIAQNLTELQNGKFDLKPDGDLFKVDIQFETIK